MNIEIVKASYNDLQLLHKIQVEAFRPLLEKYKDYNTNPGNEIIDQIIRRYNQDFTTYWLIKNHGKIVGGVRVVNKGDRCYRVSPIFIQPLEQGKGMAQKTFKIDIGGLLLRCRKVGVIHHTTRKSSLLFI